MSMGFKRRSHEVPGLNTSSLPDLIFTVLFFVSLHFLQSLTPADFLLTQAIFQKFHCRLHLFRLVLSYFSPLYFLRNFRSERLYGFHQAE